MGIINIGGQKITYDYRDNLSNYELNRVYTGLLTDGVYGGFDPGTPSLGITSTVMFAHTTSNKGILCIYDGYGSGILYRVESSSPFSISTTEVEPYIICRYDFVPTLGTGWYSEFIAVAQTALKSTDVILGKFIFPTGLAATSFDLTCRKLGVLKQMNDMINGLKIVENNPIGMSVGMNPGTVMSGPTLNTFSNFTQLTISAAPIVPGQSRIDLVYINELTFIPTVLAGTAAASPVAPSYSTYIVLAEVTVAFGAVAIYQENILDVRDVFNNYYNNINNYFVLSEIVKYPGSKSEVVTYTAKGYIDVKTYYAANGTTVLGTETYTYGGTVPDSFIETITYYIKGPGPTSGRTIVKTYTYDLLTYNITSVAIS